MATTYTRDFNNERFFNGQLGAALVQVKGAYSIDETVPGTINLCVDAALGGTYVTRVLADNDKDKGVIFHEMNTGYDLVWTGMEWTLSGRHQSFAGQMSAAPTPAAGCIHIDTAAKDIVILYFSAVYEVPRQLTATAKDTGILFSNNDDGHVYRWDGADWIQVDAGGSFVVDADLGVVFTY